MAKRFPYDARGIDLLCRELGCLRSGLVFLLCTLVLGGLLYAAYLLSMQ